MTYEAPFILQNWRSMCCDVPIVMHQPPDEPVYVCIRCGAKYNYRDAVQVDRKIYQTLDRDEWSDIVDIMEP